MSDTDTDFEDDQESPEETPLQKQLRNEVKERNKRIKDLEAKVAANEAAARRVAFMDAGIPDTPQTKFFREKYDGEISEEAIKAAAFEHGFLSDNSAETSSEIDKIEGQSEAAWGTPAELGQSAKDAMYAEMRGKKPEEIEEILRRNGQPTVSDFR